MEQTPRGAEEEKNFMQTKKTTTTDARLITKRDLCTLLSASEASIDRWLRTDPSFPQPRRLGPGSIRWILAEVSAFIATLHPVEYDDHAFDPQDGGAA